jgi:hypothetical protein
MRTKALLGLAALAASAIGASAANVYSLNVVGYINQPLHEGFQVIGNQLDLDGTGLNNTVTTVFSSNLPVNSIVYTWNGSSWANASTFSSKTKTWSPANLALNPGQAAFVKIPAGAYGGVSSNATIVGNVLQGSLVNTYVASGPVNSKAIFSPVASIVPLSGGLQTTLKYVPQRGDQVFQYNGTSWAIGSIFSTKSGTWSPSEPSIALGEGFFLAPTNGPAVAGWTQNFTVQ